MLATFAGALPFFNDAVAGTVVQVKSGMGMIYALKLVNTTAATAYLQIFDLASANVTLGSTTAKMTYRLAANESVNIPLSVPLELGRTTTNAGISLAGTTTATGSTGAAISVSALFQ